MENNLPTSINYRHLLGKYMRNVDHQIGDTFVNDATDIPGRRIYFSPQEQSELKAIENEYMPQYYIAE